MSIKQISKVLDEAVVDSRAELLVLIALADCANDEDGWCWPSIQYLAQRARCSYRQAHRIVIHLEKHGKILIQRKRGRNHTNRYKLNLTPCPVLVEVKSDITVAENKTNHTVKPDMIMSDEPSRTVTKEEPSIPPWVPIEPWNGFCEMRKSIRKPLKGRAVGLILGKLEKLRASGQDPGEVLDQSTENSWQGVFELRQVRNGQASKQVNRAEERQQQGLDNIAKALRNRLSEVDGSDPGAIHEYPSNGATGNGVASGLAASRQGVRDAAISGGTGGGLDKGEVLSPTGRDPQRDRERRGTRSSNS